MKLTMIGRLSECLLLSYRTQARSVDHLVPEGLELVTLDDWAFWNIVVCRIEKIRPAVVPRPFGMSYYHIAYRLYVRAHVASGETIEGLYFIRSDADSFLISEMGNLASDFRFHPARVTHSEDSHQLLFETRSLTNDDGNARLSIDLATEPSFSTDSCFESMKEARRFLKYRPLGLAVEGRALKIAEVFRDESNWEETPVRIEQARWNLFERLNQKYVSLELATRVAPIDYRWRLGRRETLG